MIGNAPIFRLFHLKFDKIRKSNFRKHFTINTVLDTKNKNAKNSRKYDVRRIFFIARILEPKPYPLYPSSCRASRAEQEYVYISMVWN